MTLKDSIFLFLKGVAMGAADIVPGVSGGTVAFITGIYSQLIASLQRLGPAALWHWYRNGWSAFWVYINGRFLTTVFSGVLTGIFFLAHLMTFLLNEYPIPTWSLFIGLVLFSALWLLKDEPIKTMPIVLGLIVGFAAGWIVTALNSAWVLQPQWYIFIFAGALAVCAMILPGISGSFILLLLGLYQPVIQAVKHFDFLLLALVATGCVCGLLLFSKVLNWMLTHLRSLTLAVLTGLMLGSINRLWPWKVMESSYGENTTISALGQNVSPFMFDGDAQLASAIIAFLVGGAIVFSMHKINGRMPSKSV